MEQEGLIEKVKAIIFGHAVGDAVGGPVQFEGRSERDKFPVTDMMPFDDPRFPKGAWSDDTSMSLCAMDALIKHGLDFKEVMSNFKKWLFENEFTPTGVTFDVGSTCFRSIEEFSRETLTAEGHGRCGEYENGNGSLMRIYPFSLYLYCSDFLLDEKISYIHRASALTHAHPRSCIGCGIYSFVLWELFENSTKQGIRDGLKKAEAYYQGETEFEAYRRLCPHKEHHQIYEEIDELLREEIQSSGYVVDTLEAAIWCVLTTENFRDCILKAVNLGFDTDSVGAVAGSLAGLLYGFEGIPEDWRNSLLKKEELEELGKKFCDTLCGSMLRFENLKFYHGRGSSLLDFFFVIEEEQTGKERADMVHCDGNPPCFWHNAENYPFCGDEEIVVIFEYQQKIMSDTAINGLAFTTYRNYKRYLRARLGKNSVVSNVSEPFWDYTAIYRIPDFPTFREAREYLVDHFGLKAENIREWSGHKDRKYHCGLIQ